MRGNLEPTSCVKKANVIASIAVIAEQRYLSHAQPSGMIRALKGFGHQVQLIDPEEMMFDVNDPRWMKDIDIAVARGRSSGVFFILDWLERHSVPVINPCRSVAAVHNKAEMTIAFASAGISMPRTWIGHPQQIARNLLPGDFPVIVKPIFGDNCCGLQLIHSPAQMSCIIWPDSLAIVQQFISGCDFDLKLYCIGREVFAVRKPSPLIDQFSPRSAHQASELLPLQRAWRNLALDCGKIFGLELFGVDCIETSEGPLVIEVNEFPNYSAVPGADEKLSEYILASLRQERES